MSESRRPLIVAAVAVAIALVSLGVALALVLRPEPKGAADRLVESIQQQVSEPGHVPTRELEATVSDKLEQQVGTRPAAVDCPEPGLRAREGAELTCELTAPNGDRVDVFLTATTVVGDNVNFDFKVGTEVR